MGQSVACVVYVLKWVTSQIKVLLGANYVDIASVVDDLANKRNVLQTEQCDFLFQY